MEDGVEKLIINGVSLEIHYDKTGYWKNDKIYIYDCVEGLREEESDLIIDYLYEEGFIMDRRVQSTIVRGGL